jgi:hypothetical protein
VSGHLIAVQDVIACDSIQSKNQPIVLASDGVWTHSSLRRDERTEVAMTVRTTLFARAGNWRNLPRKVAVMN